MRKIGSVVRIFSAFFLAALITGAVSCRAQPRVVIATQSGKELAVTVEVADTPAKRELGLQFRRQLDEDGGMIFLFPSESELSFWMKNTPVSLDIIFINAGRKIVGIAPRTIPFSTDSLSVQSPSRFVLEVNGGFAERHGVTVGDAVRFEGISADGVRE
jgi:uncharacterized membrane protein (UPF0127 family)